MSAATVVYVAYGVETVDLDWLPKGTPVVIVHNDDRFDRGSVRAGVTHVDSGGNRPSKMGETGVLVVLR